MATSPIERIGNVTSASVLKHTKKDWDQWIKIFEKAGAQAWTRQEIVAFLSKKYKLTLWWQYVVSSGYEVQLGRRAVGRNAKGLFSVTTTKTIYTDGKSLWKLVASEEGMAIWLAPMYPIKLAPKTAYEREDGVYGEIRTMQAGKRIRLSWREGDWDRVTYVMVYVVGRANGTSMLAFTHENLKDGRLREPLRDLWRDVVDRLAEMTPKKKPAEKPALKKKKKKS